MMSDGGAVEAFYLFGELIFPVHKANDVVSDPGLIHSLTFLTFL
jgi:hypothetical protein